MTRKPNVRGVEERNRLVEEWSGLSAHVVTRMWRKHPSVKKLGIDDAICIANQALIRAAEIWEEYPINQRTGERSKKPIKFNTYAIACIKCQLVAQSLENADLIRVPRYALEAVVREEDIQDGTSYKNYVEKVRTVFSLKGFDYLICPSSLKNTNDSDEIDRKMKLVTNAMRRLSKLERYAVRECVMGGTRHEDAARAYGTTRGTVSRAMNMALVKLRNWLNYSA